MSKPASIISIKARDIQVGDEFVNFGTVRSVLVFDDEVWLEIARPRARKTTLFGLASDMDVHTHRVVSA